MNAPGGPAQHHQFTTPARRERLHFTMPRIVATTMVAVLFTTMGPARAVDCAPADRECRLAVAVVRLDADLAVERARVERVTAELAACQATQGACPPPPRPEPYPWGAMLSAGAVGVVVGLVVGVVLAR